MLNERLEFWPLHVFDFMLDTETIFFKRFISKIVEEWVSYYTNQSSQPSLIQTPQIQAPPSTRHQT